MKTERDIREFRDTYSNSLKDLEAPPELIRRYKFAVNLLSYILDESTPYGLHGELDIPFSSIIVGGEKPK